MAGELLRTSSMILLITPSNRGPECAKAIEEATSHTTLAVSTFHNAADLLRNQEFCGVVIDDCLMEADPDQGHLIAQVSETATTVYVNCAISSTQRIVRAVRLALQRREQEQAVARRAALMELQRELSEFLTGLILNCELALKEPNLPVEVEQRIHTVEDLAHQLANKFQVDAAQAVKA